jgi:hypothetical protein
VSAAAARIVAGNRAPAGTHAAAEWEQIGEVAPELAVTTRRYLAQADVGALAGETGPGLRRASSNTTRVRFPARGPSGSSGR